MTNTLHDTQRSSYDLWKYLVQQECIRGRRREAPQHETIGPENINGSDQWGHTGSSFGVELIGLDD